MAQHQLVQKHTYSTSTASQKFIYLRRKHDNERSSVSHKQLLH